MFARLRVGCAVSVWMFIPAVLYVGMALLIVSMKYEDGVGKTIIKSSDITCTVYSIYIYTYISVSCLRKVVFGPYAWGTSV